MKCRIAAIAALLVSPASATADPLSDLLAKGNGSACFERVYDDAHLAENPKQKTLTALLSLKTLPPEHGDGAVLRLRFERKDGDLYVVGSCTWAAKANLDTQGDKMIPAFKGPSGLDCHALTTADGSSAEEGGDFPIDLRDGSASTVYLPESLAAWRSIERAEPADWIDFGRDDNVFRLYRTGPGACRGLSDALPWLE